MGKVWHSPSVDCWLNHTCFLRKCHISARFAHNSVRSPHPPMLLLHQLRTFIVLLCQIGIDWTSSPARSSCDKYICSCDDRLVRFFFYTHTHTHTHTLPCCSNEVIHQLFAQIPHATAAAKGFACVSPLPELIGYRNPRKYWEKR